MPTSNGLPLRRTCQVVLMLRQVGSSVSAIPMTLVVSGSSAVRLRPDSTTAGCSTNEGPGGQERRHISERELRRHYPAWTGWSRVEAVVPRASQRLLTFHAREASTCFGCL